MLNSITGVEASGKKMKLRKMICPRCGLIGYGPYVQIVYDKREGRVKEIAHIVHVIKIQGIRRAFKTCVIEAVEHGIFKYYLTSRKHHHEYAKNLS